MTQGIGRSTTSAQSTGCSLRSMAPTLQQSARSSLARSSRMQVQTEQRRASAVSVTDMSRVTVGDAIRGVRALGISAAITTFVCAVLIAALGGYPKRYDVVIRNSTARCLTAEFIAFGQARGSGRPLCAGETERVSFRSVRGGFYGVRLVNSAGGELRMLCDEAPTVLLWQIQKIEIEFVARGSAEDIEIRYRVPNGFPAAQRSCSILPS